MIIIDNTEYKATWVEGLEQSVDILNGDGTGRMQGTGDMYIEPLGSFLNHKGALHRDGDCTDEEWNNLFLTLCNPENEHTVTFPFGVSNTITQKVYITKLKRSLSSIKGTNKWEKVLEVSFVAMKPFWGSSGILQGVE